MAGSSGESNRCVADDDAQLAEIVRSAADAVVVQTPDGIVTVWNRAAEELYGFSATEMLGQRVDRLFPAERRADESAALRQVAGGLDRCGYVAERIRRDGVAISVSVRAVPIRDNAGVTTGVLTTSWHSEPTSGGAAGRITGLVQVDKAGRVGHELRTSLNAIIGFTGTLLMRLPGPLNGEQERQLQLVQSSAETLLARINELSRALER